MLLIWRNGYPYYEWVRILFSFFCIYVGTRTLSCVTRQGDCTYRYFVGTSTSSEQPPIVFEGESKKPCIVFVSMRLHPC